MSELPDDTHVGRVALAVADVDGVASFYADAVGLERVSGGDDHASLGAGGTPLVELQAAPDAPARPRDAAGLFHVAVRVPSRGALGDALGRLRDSGRMTGASDHLVSEALYARDPEDNGVEVYRDRPREDWERTPEGQPRIDTLRLDLEDLARGAAGADRVPPGTAVGHVHLEVTDLEAARSFYVDALGFDLVDRMHGGLFVAAGGYHHHVGLNVWNRRSAPAEGRGLAWFELVVPTADDRSDAVARLSDAGYDVRETEVGSVVEDPDGIEVRLTVGDCPD